MTTTERPPPGAAAAPFEPPPSPTRRARRRRHVGRVDDQGWVDLRHGLTCAAQMRAVERIAALTSITAPTATAHMLGLFEGLDGAR